ncbi:unnamed protein product [Arctogadus glacialis]
MRPSLDGVWSDLRPACCAVVLLLCSLSLGSDGIPPGGFQRPPGPCDSPDGTRRSISVQRGACAVPWMQMELERWGDAVRSPAAVHCALWINSQVFKALLEA